MAGFSVANLDFGKNTVNAELERQKLAASERASQRSADLQRRAQDIQAGQQQAQLAEGARQFDQRMAETAAGREEGARQFDERMGESAAQRAEGARQFDQNMDLKNRQQTWDEALKQQQLDEDNAKMQKWAAELDRFLELGRRDQEEYDKKMAMQKEMQESELFNVVEGVMLGGEIGGFTPSQVRDHNAKFGTQYDVIGTRDMLSGQPYGDGLIHRIQYQRDGKGNIVFGHMENGQVVEDGVQPKQGSQPLLLRDDVVTKDEFEFGSSRLREYGPKTKNGSGWSPERMALEQQKVDLDKERLKIRNDELNARIANGRVSQILAKNRNAISAAKSLDELSRVLGDEDYKEVEPLILEQLKESLSAVSNDGDNIPGYAPAQIAELKKRGYKWNGSQWVK